MYPQVFGKYVLERELARGGMARVVLATLRGAGGFEKKLVVKQIRDELACDDEFVRASSRRRRRPSPWRTRTSSRSTSSGVELGTYFLAMEFVEGASLAELLARRRRERKATRALAGGGRLRRRRGLPRARLRAPAHERRPPRRDAAQRDGRRRGAGQGHRLRHRGAGGDGAERRTASSVRPGTCRPSRWTARSSRPAADVFAVAVLLMELWSGKAPFRRRTREDIEAAMRAPHPKPSDADIRLLPLDDVIAQRDVARSGGAAAAGRRPGARAAQVPRGIDLDDVARTARRPR